MDIPPLKALNPNYHEINMSLIAVPVYGTGAGLIGFTASKLLHAGIISTTAITAVSIG